MCRLLYIRSKNHFDPIPHLEALSTIAQSSKWYQGHGWGCAYLLNDKWVHYKNINPIWDNDFSFIQRIKVLSLIVHVRSAFLNQGITIENNMPFYDDRNIFVFNGELKGVKIKSKGKIGAEKIFNFIKRFINKNEFITGFEKGIKLINSRTDYIRGMNIIMTNESKAYISSIYNEDPDYFTLHYSIQNDNFKVVCSKPYDLIKNWKKLENKSFLEI